MFDSLPIETARTHTRAKKIVEALELLPTLPSQALKIIQMLMDEDTDIRDVVRLIESDPALGMKILSLVNAPAIGLAAPVNSIRKGVLMLGVAEVRSLLLRVVVSDSIVKSLQENGTKAMDSLWRHSLACGVCAEMIAARSLPSMAAEAFVSGLLHDVGRLIIAGCFPDSLEQISSRCAAKNISWTASEQDVLGIDHQTVGKWLAEKWGLPEIFIHSIWLHHHTPDTLKQLDFIPHRKLLFIVQMANQLVHEVMADSLPGAHPDAHRDHLLSELGLTGTDLESLSGALGKAYCERAAIVDLDENEASFYRRALQRTHRRWVRSNGQKTDDYRDPPRAINAGFLLDMHRALHGLEDLDDMIDWIAETIRTRLGKSEGLVFCRNWTLKKLVGRYWSSGHRPATFALALSKKGHPLWQTEKELPPAFHQVLVKTYKAFVLLPKINQGQPYPRFIDRYRVMPFIKQAFIGAATFKEAPPAGDDLADPSPEILRNDDHFGHIAGTALASVMLIGKLRMTADALSTALTRNRRVMTALNASNEEKRKMEREIVKAQKLESIGFLAGGIAHDFNNILTAITGSVSLAKIYAKPENKAFEKLIQAEKALQRAKDLNEQLLSFAKGNPPVKRLVSIRDVVKEAVDFTLSGANVRCHYDIPDHVAMVELDAGQINQVFNNLIINAVQAMPDGGTIRIGAENHCADNGGGLPLAGGNYVKITVQDNGTGMRPGTAAKVFDPYFTTKPDGNGLGLSTAYTIVKNHGGYMKVESELNAGAVFSIYLPASEKKPVSQPVIDAKLHTGNGKILVMDDEADLRDLAGEMLGLLGYDVRFAKDGTEAIEAYRHQLATPHPFDAVLMDLTVPGGMGGLETIEKLQAMDPHVKAVVTSGYSEDPAMIEYQQHGFAGAIAKPYRMLDLSKLLHDIHHIKSRAAVTEPSRAG